MQDLTWKEYEFLRKEIDQQQALHNTLVTFTITTVVALISFVASMDNVNPNLFLLAFCIIIPMSTRIAYYRKATAKISAYMITFLEPHLDGISWETRNVEFSEKHGGLSHQKNRMRLNYYECFILGIVCYTLFVAGSISGEAMNYQLFLKCAIPFSLVIWEGMITHQINKIDINRVELKELWKTIDTPKI